MAIENETLDLPTDIIGFILLKLPVKSLLRFKIVSKSWNAMMTDSRFVQTHLHQSKHSKPQNLFIRHHLILSSSDSQQFSLLKFDGRNFQTKAELEYSFGKGNILCFYDGVVLLNNFSFDRIYVLWNPCNQTTTRFWCPYTYRYHAMNYGICHDLTIDDFKVVTVSMKYYAIFSCKNNSWTKRESSLCTSGMLINNPGVCVNEAIYWVWRDKNEIHIKEIIYFDPRDDELKILQKPTDVKGSDTFSLICFKGCLCLYRNKGEMMIEIWIKGEGRDDNSWTEFMVIENLKVQNLLFKPLCFVENKILIRLSGSRFVMYSPCQKTFEEFEESELVGVTLVPCLDSLFCPVVKSITRPKRKINAFIVD